MMSLLALTVIAWMPVNAPLEDGVYNFGGAEYACTWESKWLFIRPLHNSAWRGEGIIVNGRLRIHWSSDHRDCVGVYAIGRDRRSLSGKWSYLGESPRCREQARWSRGIDE